MKIIYCCYGGTHSSPVAAAIHLGKLSTERVPTGGEIRAVELFDQLRSDHRGQVMFFGMDQWGNGIYVCGRGRDKRGIVKAVKSGAALAGGNLDELLFVDTLPAVNWLMRIGGFLSRRLGLVAIGRPLVVKGTQKAFFNLANIVAGTIKTCRKNPELEEPG
ncbi:MAG TPA: DUF3189 family protein [Limnochordia bacterium]|nr:DUF3189 family protein [Bacillota bacterium]HOB07898.1 DUF3189 family protein [Limnochordia bacterium]HPT93429.1 DUF3189 family protein [Limnochordia bacterium]HPZ29949.1 DUF3189 family protein [Limnochordia bacterium]HQD70355.1 DUF3189 family protein [Limnochordia bacterium]